ncbi:MAG: toxin-antitoxin system YwqK family antitoxin [Bacteroidota bacterium]
MKRHFIFSFLLVLVGMSMAQTPQNGSMSPTGQSREELSQDLALAKSMSAASKVGKAKPVKSDVISEPVRKILASALEMRNDIAYAPVKQGKEIVGMAPFTGIALVMWPNNRVYTEQGYVNGLKQGKYQENTEKGIFVASETWANGKKNGPFQYADEKTGIVVASGEFLDDSLHNVVKGFYLNGVTQYSKHYNRGVRNGESISYYDNGKTEQIATFVNDVPHGPVIAFYPDSVLRYIKEYKMGVPNGRFYLFHRNGCAASEDYYKNGEHDSISRVWDAVSCNLIAESSWSNGKKHGAFVQYNAFGDTLRIENYYNGLLEGRFVEVREVPNEATKRIELKIESEGVYRDGLKYGPWKHGMVSHYQQRDGTYDDDGEMVGEWLFYDNQGLPLLKQTYDIEGNLVKEKYIKVKKK